MLGIGPEWIHTNAYGKKMNSVGVEVAPDCMLVIGTRELNTSGHMSRSRP